MELDFKGFLENKQTVNAPGRAGQHFWKPETPMLRDNTPEKTQPQLVGKKPLKGTNLNHGFRPLPPAPFRGLTADKFGIKKIRVPKPYI